MTKAGTKGVQLCTHTHSGAVNTYILICAFRFTFYSTN